MSATRQIIDAIRTRLGAITTAGGYNTDAGLNVHVGRETFDLDEDTLPALNLLIDAEDAERITTAGRYRNDLALSIVGYLVDPDTATLSILDLVHDVQRAMELPDDTLGGLADTLQFSGFDRPDQFEREQGAAIRIFYVVTYDREYGE